MNNSNNNNEIPVQVLELLPWYALGLLEKEEKQIVEKALLEFPELQEHLKSENEMVQYLREEKELFSLSAIEDREERPGHLLQREEFSPKASEQAKISSGSKLSSFFQSLFSGHMTKPQYMGFAAITTVSIALIFAITSPLLESESTFYPAAAESEQAKSDKNTLLIGLSVEPDNPQLLEVLKKHKVEATTIVGKDGMYRLRFINDEPKKKELETLLSTLSKHKDLIWFVGEAY